jgi:glycosyltransferase involved in cell wall biosynthesis
MVKRITFVISSLSAGGAERVMSIMANYWAQKEINITLLTFNDSSERPFFELDSRIQYIPLGLTGISRNPLDGILNNFKRILALRGAIRKTNPDTVISFQDTTNIITILATRGLKIPVIVSEHNEPTVWNIGMIWNMMRRLAYPMANKVILLSERARSYYPEKVRRSAIVIPNPVQTPPTALANVDIRKPAIIAMGRFGHEKGFDILLRAFALAGEDNPDWSLTILGDGSQRRSYEDLIENLNLQGRVFMPGRVQNPYDYLKLSDIFVLSSRNECFPMVLCEAMACGVPVISFDCMTGPREIITDGVDGILVPPEDEEQLASAMSKLMGDKLTRNRMGKEGKQIIERFGVDKIMAKWEELIAETQD